MSQLGPFEVGQIKAYLYDGLEQDGVASYRAWPESGFTRALLGRAGVAFEECGAASWKPERIAAPISEDWATGGDQAGKQKWPQTVGGSKRHFQRHLPIVE